MQIRFYHILSHIRIDSNLKLWPEWDMFQEKEPEKYTLQVTLKYQNDLVYGIEILGKQPGNIILKKNDSILCVNNVWTRAKLSTNNNCVESYKLLNILLLSHLSISSVLEMHASLIARNEKGIMFIGHSGIGKTTQAELWGKYREAQIINGDRVFIKQTEKCFLGCGSPWHGSSPYCLNKQVPLSALIVLKQSPQNSIRRLTGLEMISSVMNSVFFPTWYKEGHEAACQTLDTLLKTVPVYELSCRPDEDAVRITEDAVFGGRL